MENYSQEIEQHLLLVGHNIKDLQNWSLASRSSDTRPYVDFDESRCIGFDHTFQVGRNPNFFTQPCTTVFVFLEMKPLGPMFCGLLLWNEYFFLSFFLYSFPSFFLDSLQYLGWFEPYLIFVKLSKIRYSCWHSSQSHSIFLLCAFVQNILMPLRSVLVRDCRVISCDLTFHSFRLY